MRLFRRSFAAACCLAAALYLPTAAQNKYASAAALRDIRIYVRFEPGTGYDNDEEARADFRRASEMAMRMWESIFPTMRVFFVSSPSAANLTFNVGNYAGIPKNDCGAGGGAPNGTWSGCSFRPDANGNIAGGNIWFNVLRPGGASYRYDRFNLFSRDALYSSYRPATDPPEDYDTLTLADGAGWIDGRFPSQLVGMDGTHIIFHEFGHSVGLGHVADDVMKFYGIPYPRGGTQPATPNLIRKTSAYPLLPGDYYGGGQPGNFWVSDLRPLGMYLGHMLAWDRGGKPYGVPTPQLDRFNFRVVHPDDYTQLLTLIPRNEMHYPNTKSLIRLVQSSGSAALTSSWASALTWAQLDRPGAQSNPYFVTGIYSAGQIQRVAAGAFHTLAIRDDGSLWSWGSNAAGQLGNGSFTSSASPVRIGTDTRWVSVAAGENFSLALRSDNTLWAWGDRSYGQIGDGLASGTPQTTLKQVPGFWSAVKAGTFHVIALNRNGTLWAWGYNAMGQLGYGGNSDQPAPVQEYTKANDWVAVAAGSQHSLGMKASGNLYGWGGNDHGTLGDGTHSTTNRPLSPVSEPKPWLMPEAGHEHSVGLGADGKIYAWGRNQYKQLGAATTAPDAAISLPVAAGFVTVAAGSWHNAAIKADGTLWSWGINSQGQLGNTSVGLGGTSSALIQEQTGSRLWSEIFAVKERTLAVRTDGTLWGWGANGSGQLGNGTTTSSASPVRSKFADLPTVKFYVGLASGEKNIAPNEMDYSVTSTGRRTIYLNTNLRGNLTKLEFLNGSTVLSTISNPAVTAAYTWTNVGRGSYPLRVRATDWTGEVVLSPVFTVNIHQVDISSATAFTAPLNLTNDAGPSGDWVQWGHWASEPYETRRNIGTPLINLTVVPSTTARYPNSAAGFSWTDGKPTLSATDQRQYVGVADGTGFASWSFRTPVSSTTIRTVKSYVWVAPSVTAAFKLYLDGASSSTVVTSPEFKNTGTSGVARVFTITYRAAKSGYTAESSSLVFWSGNGNVPGGIQAVTYR